MAQGRETREWVCLGFWTKAVDGGAKLERKRFWEDSGGSIDMVESGEVEQIIRDCWEETE